ncbi:PqqD family protein [Eubacterium sp. AM05-23]|uniref:PqqD family protein n=1 Tax=Eubacterium TaxID=1730 RepID=UPI000E49A3D2|nr:MULTISPECIES: PqqD family protein [Eubacterium]RHO60385.1 PqqD family protein [Eubacterium sp. AM05-23]
MKIKEGFYLREIVGETVVVPTGSTTLDFRGMINLEGIGGFLWKQLEKGGTKEEMLTNILEVYDVDRETAEQDLDAFIKRLTEFGFLEM